MFGFPVSHGGTTNSHLKDWVSGDHVAVSGLPLQLSTCVVAFPFGEDPVTITVVPGTSGPEGQLIASGT